MPRGGYTKVAQHHAQTTPGWVVPDSAPKEWIERVIKPLLAEVMTPPPRFEPHHEQQRHQVLPSAASKDRRVRLIGWIHLAVAANPDAYSARSYPREQRSLMAPLYWVSAPGVGQQVAIAPQLIGAYSYYYDHASLEDLRYLAGPEALRALLEALLEQLRQQAFNDQKVNKVRKLQTQAVLAHLRQIANEERFAFHVTTTARDGNSSAGAVSAPDSLQDAPVPVWIQPVDRTGSRAAHLPGGNLSVHSSRRPRTRGGAETDPHAPEHHGGRQTRYRQIRTDPRLLHATGLTGRILLPRSDE